MAKASRVAAKQAAALQQTEEKLDLVLSSVQCIEEMARILETILVRVKAIERKLNEVELPQLNQGSFIGDGVEETPPESHVHKPYAHKPKAKGKLKAEVETTATDLEAVPPPLDPETVPPPLPSNHIEAEPGPEPEVEPQPKPKAK